MWARCFRDPRAKDLLPKNPGLGTLYLAALGGAPRLGALPGTGGMPVLP